MAQPAFAQDRNAPPRLEDLIPDSAVEDPEAWAGASEEDAVAEGEEAAADASELDPETPMAELPELSVEWPDEVELPPFEPLDPEEDARLAADDVPLLPPLPESELVEIDDELVLALPQDEALFPQRREFIERFSGLSTIEELDGDDDSIAQLAARAREDEELLIQLLRIYGYYDAQVVRSVGGIRPGEDNGDTQPVVRFDIIPGVRYNFGEIDLGNLASAPDAEALRETFAIQTGDPLSSDRIVEQQFELDKALGETGYAFAEIDAPELLIDHREVSGDLTMPVEPNGKYVFGGVESNLPDFLSSRHLQTIARFEEGDVYQRSLQFDLRRAITSTGLVSSVTVTPREVEAPSGEEPGAVILDVEMAKAELRTIAGAIGYGSEDGFQIQASWEHRNLFPPEGALKVSAILGTKQQLASVSFKRNNFRARDQVLTLDAYASDIETDAVEARTVAFVSSFERLSNLLFQKPFSWSLGAGVLYTDERNRVIGGVPRPRQEYLIGGFFGRATIDTSDSLLDPTEGFRVTGYLSPEASRSIGTTSFYVRSQVDAAFYQSVGEGTVLAGRARFASIPGAALFRIAPSRRLYAGGGGSIRGYGYQAVGPKNDFGEPTGGRSLVEVSAEARIDTGLMDGAVSIVPFIDAGTVSLGSVPDFRFIKYGAGVGLRYDTGFGPIRVDVGVPLNPDQFDSKVAVYVSLGQAF
ncbi:autotransporter assembly complex family protein [Erythrobacter sp. HKB08]|uniref:autotransporter assembly complex protein TamA n=1 Tax=Erythrobacter sp. HKB08 TaxID=2502843 RepID=UPI00100910D6|nr:BamA/TamA family outer membrane protein [Erythrobacter sp. HKB08]